MTETHKRQCYWLQEREPCPGHPLQSRVCLVTEGEPSYQPTGGGTGDEYVEPWYWDHATCVVMNRRHFGLSEDEANDIVVSSMFGF